MDNIAKLVLGVVGIIGLVVLMLPQGNPLEDKGVVAAATQVPDDIPDEAPKNEPETASSSPNLPTQGMGAFGQPMMDPTPPGQQQTQQPQQGPQQPATMGNEGNYTGEEPVAPYPANPSMGTPSYGVGAPGPIPTGQP